MWPAGYHIYSAEPYGKLGPRSSCLSHGAEPSLSLARTLWPRSLCLSHGAEPPPSLARTPYLPLPVVMAALTHDDRYICAPNRNYPPLPKASSRSPSNLTLIVKKPLRQSYCAISEGKESQSLPPRPLLISSFVVSSQTSSLAPVLPPCPSLLPIGYIPRASQPT